MCLLLVSFNSHSEYPLIVAANRDEFYSRPAEKASFWKDHSELLAGKDLEAGGTWLGITKNGRFAVITNYRDIKSIKDNAPTRGELVTDFLLTNNSPEEYGKGLFKKANDYNGFNLLFSDLKTFYYFSNQTSKLRQLSAGVYGLSNHLLDTPWPKVVKSKDAFTKTISANKISADNLLEILADDRQADDDQLPDTGLSVELERIVSPIFIKSEKYGTRSSTVLIVDKQNKVLFIEKSLDIKTKRWKKSKFEFRIKNLGSNK
jgi:uncharacterized protein with NRDE domain